MENIIKRGNQELSYGLAAAHSLLGWIKDSNDSSICLSELGGFDEHHALFLSKVLWAQRDSTMLTFCDVFLPGWSLVMHAMWKHAVFLGGPRVMRMLNRLRELVIRYSFVCVSFEDFVVYRHYLELHSMVDHPTKLGPMNRSDLTMEVSCCVLKLAPPEDWTGAPRPIPLDFATDLMEAVFYDIQQSKHSPELCLPMVKAGFTRLWVDLSKSPEDKSIKWIHIIPFTYQLLNMTRVNLLFANEPTFKRIVPTFPILSVVLEANLVDVLGRLCLMPMLLSTINPPGVETGETVVAENNHGQWTNLTDIVNLLDSMSQLPKSYFNSHIKPGFAPYQPDWLKTYNFMRQLSGNLSAQDQLRRWLTVVSSMWLKLSMACGFHIPHES
ncbi:hypothetical protein FRC09_012017, partial [Ceratobasidium sp. 395]